MTYQNSDLSILLARRQKRLHYWKQWLLKEGKALPESIKAKLKEDLETFGLLLSKYSVIKEALEIDDCEKRLSTLEREFNSLFESRRLLTSKNGTPSVGENKGLNSPI